MFNNSHSSEENNFYAEFESPPPYDSVYFEQNNDNDSFAGRTYTPINSSNNNNNANSLNGRLPSPPSKNSSASSLFSKNSLKNFFKTSKTHTRSSSSTSSKQIANRHSTNLSPTLTPPSSTKRECIVCIETVDARQFIQITSNCTHANNICRDCISRHIEHEVQDKGSFEIRCPDENCRNILTEETIRRIATEEVFKRYQKLSLVSAVSQIPDFRWCSNPQCDSGQIHYEGDAAPIMTCQACSQKSCIIHSLPIPAGSLNCPQCACLTEALDTARDMVQYHMSKRLKERGIEPTEEQRQLFESFFESLIRNVANNLVEQRKVYEMDEEIRRQDELEKEQMIRRLEEETNAFIASITKMCPKCNVYIEKNGGCDHMTCRAPGCGYEFCWFCLADYDAIRKNGNHFHKESCQYYASFNDNT